MALETCPVLSRLRTASSVAHSPGWLFCAAMSNNARTQLDFIAQQRRRVPRAASLRLRVGIRFAEIERHRATPLQCPGRRASAGRRFCSSSPVETSRRTALESRRHCPEIGGRHRSSSGRRTESREAVCSQREQRVGCLLDRGIGRNGIAPRTPLSNSAAVSPIWIESTCSPIRFISSLRLVSDWASGWIGHGPAKSGTLGLEFGLEAGDEIVRLHGE